MANNNGNIIGAAHSSYSGVWDTQDQYQQALAGNWPTPAYWVPTSSSDCIKWHKTREDLTSDVTLEGGTGTADKWADESTENKLLKSKANFSEASKWQATVFESASSVYSNNVSVDYHPLVVGTNSNGFFNTVNPDTNISSTPSAVTIAVLFRISGSLATTNAPIFTVGRASSENAAQSRNSLEVFDFVTDGSNNFMIIDGTGSSDIDTNANASSNGVYSVIIRADSANEQFEWNILSSASSTETNNTAASGTKSAGTISLSTGTLLLGEGYLSNSDTTFSDLSNEPVHYYDVAMWDVLLTDSEVEKVQGYHYHKYDLTNIPSGHTYASSAPTA